MLNNQLSRPKALIIDDETDICFLLSGILKQKNFQSTLAGSLAEAEKIVENETEYSVIFLDNHLPDGLGVNYISTLKRKCPSSMIVMITAITPSLKASNRPFDIVYAPSCVAFRDPVTAELLNISSTS